MWTQAMLPVLALVASFARPAFAQVESDCNPIKGEKCDPNPALGMANTFHFNATPSAETWEPHAGKVEYSEKDGVSFTINNQGDSPTIRSHFYIFGGRTEIHLKAAPGAGIISSVMLLSDTLDEVDWEFVGVNNSMALSNYFGRGEEIYTEGIEHGTPFNVFEDFHNYTTVWTERELEWYVDGERVRVLKREDALKGGKLFPQTPMRVYLGIWAGGDPRMPEGTREWAGGDTDYDGGPYTMYIKSAHVEDFSTGKEYVYGDDSGTWSSIEVVEGNSTIKEHILAPPPKSVSEKFNELPMGARIAIFAGAGVVAALLIGALIFYIIRQRRRGASEAAAAAAKAEQDRLEMNSFQKRGIDPDSFAGETGTEYGGGHAMGKVGSIRSEYHQVDPVSSASPLSGNAMPEKGWDSSGYAAVGAGAAAGAGAGAAAAGRMPLLDGDRNGPQSPTMRSPGPYHDMSPTQQHFSSPTRSASPGMPPRGPLPNSPVDRSHSTPPQQYDPSRMGSPAPPQPNRSFSANQGYGDGNDQAYWNNAGYR